jgi:hypothetical protein
LAASPGPLPSVRTRRCGRRKRNGAGCATARSRTRDRNARRTRCKTTLSSFLEYVMPSPAIFETREFPGIYPRPSRTDALEALITLRALFDERAFATRANCAYASVVARSSTTSRRPLTRPRSAPCSRARSTATASSAPISSGDPRPLRAFASAGCHESLGKFKLKSKYETGSWKFHGCRICG